MYWVSWLTLQSLLQLDPEDESLARWKASLGLHGAVNADTSGPKVCFYVHTRT